MSIVCLECGKELDIHDTTYSNINTERTKIDQHTGNIYKCEDCGMCFIDNFLTGKIERWSY